MKPTCTLYTLHCQVTLNRIGSLQCTFTCIYLIHLSPSPCISVVRTSDLCAKSHGFNSQRRFIFFSLSHACDNRIEIFLSDLNYLSIQTKIQSYFDGSAFHTWEPHVANDTCPVISDTEAGCIAQCQFWRLFGLCLM